MSDDASQLVVPAAFVALFVPPGRSRPSLPLREIAERHEFCEDLAQSLVEPSRERLWALGIAEQDVLERVLGGLQGDGSPVSAAEASWVTGRLAELLGWPTPPACLPAAPP